MAKSAAASVMVLFITTFVYAAKLGVEHFLEEVNETLMQFPSNPCNGILNNCKWKAAVTISLFCCRLSVSLNDWWEDPPALNLCERFTP